MPSAREAGANLFRREYDLDTPLESAPPIANLCNRLLADAFHSHATGIRLAPADADLGGIEYEIGDQWRVVGQIPAKPFGAVINRFKVMAALDIGRVPVQAGELHVRRAGRLHVLKIHTSATDAAHELLTITGLAESAT